MDADRLTRRDLLQWLGKATTLPLWGSLVQACGSPRVRSPGDPDARTGEDWGQRPDEEARGETGDAVSRDEPVEAEAIAQDDGTGSCDPRFEPGAEDLPVFESFPVRTVDPPDLAAILASWRLSIGGMVRREVTLSFCDLLEMGTGTQVTDFHCVEGWSVWDVPWDGVPLSKLLDRAGPRSDATFLKMGCVGGRYSESLPIAVAREPRTILALGIGGRTLPLSHGFPARVVVPRLLGYKNPKYVTRIDLVDFEHPGFWSRFGYPVSGEVPPERLREGRF